MRNCLLTVSALALALLGASFAEKATAAGAIVSTPIRGNYIYMTHRPSRGVATELAMSDCEGRYGGGCHVLASYNFGCVAIAHSHDGTHHSGWAVKPSMGMAQGFAAGQCEKYGTPCSVDIAVCE